MTNERIREHLVIKSVGIEYLDQFNELLRYVFQVTNQDLQESGYEDGEIIRAKQPILQKADVIGWFNNDQLISQLCIYPCKVNIHGKIFKMGGVTGIGTYPEYSGLGLMTDLIKIGLTKMKENGQLISYLYPYSVSYYRKKGWEIISEQIKYTVLDNQIPKYEDISGFVKRYPVDHEDVLDIYHRFSLITHGAMIRGSMEWEEYWRWDNEDEYTAAIYYDENNISKGFIIYKIAGDIFTIKEKIYLDEEAREGLWNFIFAHVSMIEKVIGNTFTNEPIAFILQDSPIEEIIEPYFMARIVDVETFLKEYPFVRKVETAFHFQVSDSLAEWNNRVFGIVPTDNGFTVTNEAIGNSVTLNIGTLTALLMSFRSPTYFSKIEHLTTDITTLRLLEQIIPNKQPYFSDYF